MTYEEAVAERERAEAEMKAATEAVSAFPRLANGLTPDEVKFSKPYRKAKARSDKAFADLRYINQLIVKNFWREERERRRAK